MLPYAIGRVGSQRYRIEQWIPRLRDCGVDVTARSFFGPRVLAVLHRPGHVVAKLLGSAAGYLGRTRSWPSRRDCDVVFLHREAFPLGPSALDHAYVSRVPYIFDFDDAIYLPAANSEHRWAAGLKSAGKTARCAATLRT